VTSFGLDGARRVCLYSLRVPCAQVARVWRAQHRTRDDRGPLPDIFKLYLPLQLLGIYAQDSLALFHIPVGSLLVCGVCALAFEEGTRMRIFFLFAFGMATHYVLDVLLIHVSGGLALLWPLSWQTWALQLVRPDNWLGTTILVAAAIIVWLVLKVRSNRRVGRVGRTHDETSSDV